MLKQIASLILRCEFYLIAIALVIFWFPDQRRIWALLIFVPIFAARFVLYRRLWKSTPLDLLFAAFLVLCAVNSFISPYSFIAPDLGGWVMLGRPLMGMLIAFCLVDRAYRLGSMNSILLPTLLLGLLLAILALVSSQWTEKSTSLMFIINLLPKLRNVPQIGFNVNEISGAMAYMTPLIAGIAAYSWTVPATRFYTQVRRVLASSVFVLLWLATFLGQSRFAIAGILPVLLAISFVIVPRGRVWAVGFVFLFAGLQLLILGGVSNPEAEALAERDQDSISSRLLIWESGIKILLDYPLTGTGMNTFRTGPVRALYPVPGYETRILPHVHNEWLQIATDLGIPGLIVVGLWFITLGRMVYTTWRHGNHEARAIVFSAACGIIAHAFYGLGDAITLWDRFAFMFWWVVGIIAAQYTLTHPFVKSVEGSLIAVKSP